MPKHYFEVSSLFGGARPPSGILEALTDMEFSSGLGTIENLEWKISHLQSLVQVLYHLLVESDLVSPQVVVEALNRYVEGHQIRVLPPFTMGSSGEGVDG